MDKTAEKRTEFENIYVAHYSRMKRFAQEYVIREEDAENIVQDVFLDLWEQNLLLLSHTNLFAYLFTAVKNRCIDFLRHKTIVQKTTDKLQEDYMKALQIKFQSLETFDEQLFSEPDIETVIQNAIESLPQKCREIFILNKIEGKKQKIIAQELNISINTVESQMAIAYKKLKEVLKDHVPLLIFLFI
ncbi:MAG: RNA polymerase subunit sigma-70 [Bacteroidia bacterium 43-41]|nr:MAG: RNA polymerase subunit sigma-70 [Bacteroidia bacterium 43-41]